jgi:uncharacterized protein YjiS (DUF1127 family)
MSQHVHDTGRVLSVRFAPNPPSEQPTPMPLRRPVTARRWRVMSALLWLFRLLFVTPIGRRAREERLGALSDRALRDIGLMRSDIGASASGMVPLDAALGGYPSAGPLVVSDRRGQPLTLVRLNRAA